MNSQRTESIFINKFKELLLGNGYKNINVNSLCNTLNLKRQTFYYHYRDLGDLIFSALMSDQISNIEKCKNFKDICDCLILYIDKNKNLFFRLFELNADSSIEYYIYEIFYQNSIRYLTSNYGDLISLKQVNSLNFLMSSFYSKLFIYYLSGKTKFDVLKFKQYILKMSCGMEEIVIKNLRESKRII